MSERIIEIVPEAGLHARPASRFVQTVNEFDATVKIGHADSDDLVPAESMIAITSLGAKCGEKVRLVAEGEDADNALDALEQVLTTPEGELADT
ncbi:phosphocarrier protein HPr [Haladaptatus pallidirubidus]|uniref:HPr family phosphocarrier protein n=1 Tax=Haladaptatus pallidirubidus TaxID=1008152 RepID=A0AAV3UQS8_9EURY|nr:phosphocarrier protein HPr [Haladaptatus pallidirubidus]